MLITIVSKLNEDTQAWTFDISEEDLVQLMQKYDGKGVSVLDDADGIADEIREIYK